MCVIIVLVAMVMASKLRNRSFNSDEMFSNQSKSK